MRKNMKAEEVYALGPTCITEEMIDAAKGFSMPQCDTNKEQTEYALENAETLLEVAQDYYRRGAFDMEHKDGATCEAEDQGGWPCCPRPAEFFIKAEHLDSGEKRRVYCNDHRVCNRFYRADQMSPIFVNPTEVKSVGPTD